MTHRPAHEALRDQRIEKGISQQTLADTLGKSQMAVWQWEAGRVSPRLASLEAWSAALDCHVEVHPNTQEDA